MITSKLNWDDKAESYSVAKSGKMTVGFVNQSANGWLYDVSFASLKYIAKGYGTVKTKTAAKKAIERAWNKWLTHAGLMPVPVVTQYPGITQGTMRFGNPTFQVPLAQNVLSTRYERRTPTHPYEPHPKFPWFCKKCGYPESEALKHDQPERMTGRTGLGGGD